MPCSPHALAADSSEDAVLRVRLPGPRRAGRPAGRGRRAGRVPQPAGPQGAALPPRAKRVIFLYMHGGPSHVDTFDYKPLLKSAGKSSARLPGQPRRSCRRPCEVQPARPERAADLRAVPAPGRSTPTTCASQQHAHRRAQPPAGVPDAAHRRVPLHPPVDRARGCCTAWAPRTRTCPASSPSARRRTSAAPRTTATPSCPPSYQATRIGDCGTPVAQAKIGNLSRHPARRPAAPAARPAAGDEPGPARAASRSTPSWRASSTPTSWASACRRVLPKLMDLSTSEDAGAYGIRGEAATASASRRRQTARTTSAASA